MSRIDQWISYSCSSWQVISRSLSHTWSSFGGGNLSKQQATKHMEQASYKTKDRTVNIASPTFVMEVAGIIDHNQNKKWQPNTLRTYLNSLRQFIEFLVQITDLQIGDFNYNTTIPRALDKQWLTSSAKESKKNKSTKPKSDKIINPQDLHIYMYSDRAKQAHDVLSTPQKTVSQTNHSLNRNFLLMSLALKNCQRSGCLTNLTIEEFVEGKDHISRGQHTVQVRNHKTAGKYGPANMVVSQELYVQLQTYIAIFRPQSGQTREVFLNWSGAPMDSGSVIHAFPLSSAMLV